VLIAPASLFVAAFAPLIDPSEKVPASRSAACCSGLSGVALCVGVESVHSIWAFLGALAMVGAAACYALSSFVVKRYNGPDLGDRVVHLDPRRRRADAAGGGRHRAGLVPGTRATLAMLTLAWSGRRSRS
jgi:drug/metabolite transporter (DMT)-like permease